MPDYNFPVPRSRGLQGNNCPSSNKQKCAKDIILHMLLGRFALEDGTTTELETIFNPELNALEIDIPEEVLQAIESVNIGPNLQRYMDWIISESLTFDDVVASNITTDEITTGNIRTDTIQLNPNIPAPERSEGLLFYDRDNKTVALYNSEHDITLQIGQESWMLSYNNNGATIPNGSPVYICHTENGTPCVHLARANTEGSSMVAGVATHDIEHQSYGFVTAYGVVRNVNTSGFTEGDTLWLSPTVAGGIQNTRPSVSQGFASIIGNVVNAAVDGSIFVNPYFADYYTRSQVDNIINNLNIGGVEIPNVVTVAFTAGTGDLYATIVEAIDYINSLSGGPSEAAADNPYLIRVTPGIYVENNPLTIPSYVSVVGDNDESCIVEAANAGSEVFIHSDESQLYNLRINGGTIGSYTGSGAESEIVRCIFDDCGIAVKTDGIGAICTVESSKNKSGCLIGLNSENNSQLNASNIYDESSTTFCLADGGNILIHNSYCNGATNGLYSNNGGFIDGHLINLNNNTNAIRTNNNSTVEGSVIQSSGATTWDILQESNDYVRLSGCILRVDKISITNASLITADFDSDLPGDEGHIFLEEIHVGHPELGRESVFGEGDSYVRGMLVYSYDAGTTTWSNHSSEILGGDGTAPSNISGTDSLFTMGTDANDAIYISSDLQDANGYKQFLGIKTQTETAIVLGGGSIVAEYWDGAAWTSFNHMSALANSPYTQYGNAIFQRTGSEQIRFDDLSDTTRFTWTANDPLPLGDVNQGTNRYWIRFRISVGITTAPIFEQFKIHSNRTEINADGFVEYMGKARKEGKIPDVSLANSFPIVGSTPAATDINVGGVFSLDSVVGATTVIYNTFENGATDSVGQITTMPAGIDTSLPLTLRIKWAPSANVASGDVAINLVYGVIKLGDVITGVSTDVVTEIVTTTINTANVLYNTSIDFHVPDSTPGDSLALMIQRQAGGGLGPTGDTYGGNIYVVSYELIGRFWN